MAQVNLRRRLHLVLLAIVAATLVWSAIRPHDYFTWFLEVAPVFVGFVLIAATYRRFPLTTFLYTLLTR